MRGASRAYRASQFSSLVSMNSVSRPDPACSRLIQLYTGELAECHKIRIVMVLSDRTPNTAPTHAWRTSCPRLSIWEDACIDGLIDHESGTGKVILSSAGREFLSRASDCAMPEQIRHVRAP
jgi:hypothetical protein